MKKLCVDLHVEMKTKKRLFIAILAKMKYKGKI